MTIVLWSLTSIEYAGLRLIGTNYSILSIEYELYIKLFSLYIFIYIWTFNINILVVTQQCKFIYIINLLQVSLMKK